MSNAAIGVLVGERWAGTFGALYSASASRVMRRPLSSSRLALVRLGLAFALGALLSACGKSDQGEQAGERARPELAAQAAATAHTMTMTSTGWSPTNINAKVGDTVFEVHFHAVSRDSFEPKRLIPSTSRRA